MSASRVTERIEPKLKMKWDEVLTSFAGGTLRILLDSRPCQCFIRYWNKNVFLCSNFPIYEMLTTLKCLNLDLIARLSFESSFYCGTWKNGWMIELERQNTVLNFCMSNKSKWNVHYNGRTSDLMGDTEGNALVENTSLFFFIMIEFSRFFKRNRTCWPHYHIKRKIRIQKV